MKDREKELCRVSRKELLNIIANLICDNNRLSDQLTVVQEKCSSLLEEFRESRKSCQTS